MAVAKAVCFVFLHLFFNLAVAFKHSSAPVITDRPFIVVWNAPTQQCKWKYDVDLDFSLFDIVVNQNESFLGQNMTIFYSSRLGYYPYYSKDNTSVNGGVPQNASLKEHLGKAWEDIQTIIPVNDFRGLAVIDWESWRPIWLRNWGSLKINIQKSFELVKKQHPDWTPSQVNKVAQMEFESGAQAFMGKTLQLGLTLRSKGLWGFYRFPACYNNDYKNTSHNYTGKCPDVEISRNDKLKWLWENSTALYPEIYLEKELKGTEKALKFVYYQLQEALKRAEQTGYDYSIPVLPYSRIVYMYTFDFLTQDDLVYTIGESAAQGAAGVVLWGDAEYSSSKNNCQTVKSYIDKVLGRYIMNVTHSVLLCSQALCTGNGRCVRKAERSSAYLHLNPETFLIKRNLGSGGPSFLVQGSLNKTDMTEMAESFLCQCYRGWKGAHCHIKTVQ
ncbi:hyaluronidase-1-like [Protopterus annectens]|uniref:hyaluronidase-1-like n=1 Tax=Protopterus annectens TaxID=7888 RepID=UPI001CFA8C78|nr:hyaluronidase-1-like [Protopterus annectens]